MRRRIVTIGVAVITLAAACSSSDDPAPEISAADIPTAAPTTAADSAPSDTTTVPDEAPELAIDESRADIDGLIATSGIDGLRILRPTGESVYDFGRDRAATQPTWSRDGTRLVTTLVGVGDPEIATIDIRTGRFDTRPAERAYFFFTWSADATSVVGLGPSDDGSVISADILDRQAINRFDTSIDGPTMYVSWEPDGRDLVVHAGPRLVLVLAPDEDGQIRDLGEVGTAFQAASWIPGTRDIVHTVAGPTGEDVRLARTNVDTRESVDLGPAFGLTQISVHPDGGRAAIGHAQPDPDGIATPVELVDLATGARSPIGTAPATWLEWSPDGTRLLMVVPDGSDLRWNVWDGTSITDLGVYAVSSGFASTYLTFADAYVEAPRMWSPDSKAIVFTELLDGFSTATVLRIDDGSRSRLGRAEVAFFAADGR